jgi:hypothetical protein
LFGTRFREPPFAEPASYTSAPCRALVLPFDSGHFGLDQQGISQNPRSANSGCSRGRPAPVDGAWSIGGPTSVGVGTPSVAEQLGHANLKNTAVYLQLADPRRAEMIERVPFD